MTTIDAIALNWHVPNARPHAATAACILKRSHLYLKKNDLKVIS